MSYGSVTLSLDQLIKLKADIIKDLEPKIRAEIERNNQDRLDTRVLKLWSPIKEAAIKSLGPLSPPHEQHVTNALSAIVRNTVGITNINELTVGQAGVAEEVVRAIVDVMLKHRKDGDK